MQFIRLGFAFLSVFLFTRLHGQTTPKKYDSLWKKVDMLILSKGLPKSALPEVNKIYLLARKEKQEGQMIRALIYRINLTDAGTKESILSSLQELEKNIIGTGGAVNAILSSILAEGYWNYFQDNRYRLYERTATDSSFKKDDVATWGVDDFHKRISALYLKSLVDEKLLKATKLETYEALLLKGNVRVLRPTLFDLLGHRALNYFTNDEVYITRPANAFEINQASAFDPAADFFARKFITSDSFSLKYTALILYQKLVAFHLYDKEPDALLDVDLKRLAFVRKTAVMENKEELYYMNIKHVADLYQDTPAAAQAWYLMAAWHAERVEQVTTFYDNVLRFELNSAEMICNRILLQKEASEGKANCFNLLNKIRKKELTLVTEKINLPGLPFRSFVWYRNLENMYCRIISIKEWEEEHTSYEPYYTDKYWNELVETKPLKSWAQPLPDTKDHLAHSVEIKVDALPIGKYILLVSANENFTNENNRLAAQKLSISGIGHISNGPDHFTMNRTTGKPLANAQVQVWNNVYDYHTRKTISKKADKLVADRNGYFRLDIKGENRQDARILITYDEDSLTVTDDRSSGFYPDTNDTMATNNEKAEEEYGRVFLFTDRSIYRPGQVVYFKGIAVTEDVISKHQKVLPGRKTTVFLHDVNSEIVDSLLLTTNEYGSYSGKFRIPENLLNGSFTIGDKVFDGNAYFSVEEYKRPKFYVTYDKVKEVFKVNDSISVTGYAKGFAGNTIGDANVTYRITRDQKFMHPLLSRDIYRPYSDLVEISNGVMTTEADGRFTIRFKAIPDLKIDKSFDPIFDYTISVDITDNSGETHNSQTTVHVAYKSIQIALGGPKEETFEKDSLRSFLIRTWNTNEEFLPALVKLGIYKLQDPGRLIRKRFWDAPDQFIMSREEYIKLFPNDEYSNETKKDNWPKQTAALETSAISMADGKFSIENGSLAPGWYLVEASTVDKDGISDTAKKYIRVYDAKSSKDPILEYITSSVSVKPVQPGEKATFSINTGAGNLTLIEMVCKTGDNYSLKKSKPDVRIRQTENGTYTAEFNISESDRGGFNVKYLVVKDSRFYNLDNVVTVPWTNKELTISYETWRDKTLPGSEEKWNLKLTGSKKEKVAAEMLASMYDASLDQFRIHKWQEPDLWDLFSGNEYWDANSSFGDIRSFEWDRQQSEHASYTKNYDQLNSAITGRRDGLHAMASRARMRSATDISFSIDTKPPVIEMIKYTPPPPPGAGSYEEGLSDSTIIAIDSTTTAVADGNDMLVPDVQLDEVRPETNDLSLKQNALQIRKNFNETAFFLPDLHTDANGNISFSFTMPEAVTRWKFQGLAHTKALQFGYTSRELVTQKELMVQPNIPRFIREGDRMLLSANVVNLTPKEMTGTIELQLLDAVTMQPVDGIFHNMNANQYFTADSGRTAVANFTIEVPYQYNSALLYRFIAKAKPDSTGNIYSDGEEATLPVLSNSMLVTESMPLPMRGNAEKKFNFTKLLESGKSETLKHYALTVEFTSKPAWNAVQSLPYLMEQPYDCAEQAFNRFYANALASMIVNNFPKLKQEFDEWSTSDTSALLSNLQKNQELKSVLLEETPWVLEAKTESQQKKNLALLFDMLRMEKELRSSLDKLLQLQSSNGGFVWFKGGADDRFITQYILTGIGHLKKLKALPAFAEEKIRSIVKTSLPYLDSRIGDDYNELVKSKADLTLNQLSPAATQFLYMRSFFPECGIPGGSLKAISYYRSQSQKYWLKQNYYMQGMTALHLFRTGDKQTASGILKSLKENATVSEEMGMYWAENKGGYYWYQAPVETQSLLIEAFGEISSDKRVSDDLRIWLLKQKQTQNWRSTKATADACYALLMDPDNYFYGANPTVTIKLGNEYLMTDVDKNVAGNGYFKTKIVGAAVKPAMGAISVKMGASPLSSSINSPLTGWGAVYWQYFETLENITPAASPLKLEKKLFIERNTERGPVLEPVLDGQLIKVGDKIKVRIGLRVDRDMEYVHMKDMRASCMEPVNVLSGYKWQDGLGYYESTKDASTNFFFGWLPKGSYVFEYALFATVAGNFSNGVTTIQCMYAPEFASHSEGVRVNVE